MTHLPRTMAPGVEALEGMKMAISSERTVWAEGMGYSAEETEALTLIYEAACERGFDGELPAGDLSEWANSLERADLDDLAAKVRELPSYC